MTLPKVLAFLHHHPLTEAERHQVREALEKNSQMLDAKETARLLDIVRQRHASGYRSQTAPRKKT